MRRRYLVIVTLLALLAGYIAWRAALPEATLGVLQPRTGTIRVYVQELAKTELPHETLIAMPIAGWLEPITLREGDAVRTGQVVATLDSADLLDRIAQVEQRIEALKINIAKTLDNRLENNALVQAEATVKAIDETVQAAEAKLKATQAVADFAEYDVERLRRLAEGDAVAERELRAAEAAWRKATADHRSDALNLAALKTLAAVSYIGPKFIRDYIDKKSYDRRVYEQQLQEAQAQLQIEKRNIERATVTSPIDGVVLVRHQTRRQFLLAGTPLLTLGDLDDLEVIAEVLTERAVHITPGDPVEIFGDAVPEGPITGKVLRVYPAGFTKISSLGVEQQRVNVAVAPDRRPQKLGANYRVEVRIYHDSADNALILPRTSLFRGNDGGWAAMVVRDGRTRLQGVTVGLMNDDEAQILDGLSPRDAVVARPAREIVPGMKVTTVPAG